MRAALLLLCAALVAACGDRQSTKNGVVQTGLPGMISAGGHTSGEVMATRSPAAAVTPGPSGTPGIPGGAEGNPGGASLGSTTKPRHHGRCVDTMGEYWSRSGPVMP